MSKNVEKIQRRAKKEVENAAVSAIAGVALGASVCKLGARGIKNINDGKILRGCAQVSGAVFLGIPTTIRQFLIVKKDLKRSSDDIAKAASKLMELDPEVAKIVKTYKDASERMKRLDKELEAIETGEAARIEKERHHRSERSTNGLADGSAVLSYYSGPLAPMAKAIAKEIAETVTPDELLDGVIRRIPEKICEVTLTGNHLRQNTETLVMKEYMNGITGKIHWSYVARMMSAFMTGTNWILASRELLDYGSTLRPRMWFTDSYLDEMRMVVPGATNLDIEEMIHTISSFVCGPDDGKIFLLTKTKKTPSHTGFTVSLYEFNRSNFQRTAIAAIMVNAMMRIDAYLRNEPEGAQVETTEPETTEPETPDEPAETSEDDGEQCE